MDVLKGSGVTHLVTGTKNLSDFLGGIQSRRFSRGATPGYVEYGRWPIGLLVKFVGLRIDLFCSPKAIFYVAWGSTLGDRCFFLVFFAS